jgi:hypothetical protein
MSARLKIAYTEIKIQRQLKKIVDKNMIAFMFCWKCKKKIELPEGKIGFRAVCENCGSDLHACKNCKYFSPGKPNDCTYPDTLYVSDREGNNFCEEFSPLSSFSSQERASPKDVSFRLFGDDKIPQKKDFNSLFDDHE